MPQGPAARLADPVMHPLPPVLTGGPPALNVMIGGQPAWKGIPLALSAAVQSAQQASEAAIKVAENIAVAAQATAVAAAGTPGAPAAIAAATAARLAAETLKASSAAAMGGALAAAAAGGASMHACTVPWPIPPHGPGVVIDGSPTVLINNMPACRLGDTIVEAIGPPSKIMMGCMTVLIGNSGSGGAGAAAGGGFVPSPPSAWQEFTNWLGNLFRGPDEQRIFFGKSILIEGSPMFQLRTLIALLALAATPSGREIFQNLENSGHTVVIKETTDANGYCQPEGSAADTMDPTRGTDSTVSWNPNHTTTDPADPVTGSPGSTVILGHELVHAMHNATGTNANGPNDSYAGQSGSSARGEERSTVGAGGTTVVAPDGTTQAVPDYSASHPTENSIRDDLGIPRRPTYYPSTWPGGAPW
jgi:uncharacterized Zn-binding protein involved in type VI secretion